MYTDIPIYLAILFLAVGLIALAKSSDLFVAGAAALARNLGVSPFVVGMVVVGFGTSAPELLVSTFSGLSGHTNLSLGNAYGSCIFNIAGILGVATIIKPLVVKRSIRLAAVPLLSAITIFSYMVLRDGVLGRYDSYAMLAIFAIAMPLYCCFDKSHAPQGDAPAEVLSTPRAAIYTAIGLAVMIGASHILVWGAVDGARALGVSELLIGLTIVAVGTSIPELASAIVAARRNESELVLGNIVGSNIFNMLAVVGIAGAISPSTDFSRYILVRDMPFLLLATLSIALFSRRASSPQATQDPKSRVIPRLYGAIWIIFLVSYIALTIYQEARLLQRH